MFRNFAQTVLGNFFQESRFLLKMFEILENISRKYWEKNLDNFRIHFSEIRKIF